MLSKPTDVIVATVGVLIILGFIYVGVERLLLSKFNAVSSRDYYSRQLNQCQSNLAKAQLKITNLTMGPK